MTEEVKPAKGKKEKAPKEKGKGGGNLVLVIVLALLVIILLGVGGFAAYIFLLPDTFPKPFYLAASPETSGTPSESSKTPAPESTPAVRAPTVAQPAALPMPGEGLMFDTGTKIVNLSDPGGRRYLKISIVLEFAPPDAAFYTLTGEARTAAVTEFNTSLTAKKPIIDDLLNTLISNKTFDAIYTVDGKEALRQDIITRTNALLPSERLMYVYFTEFVIQ